MKESIELLKTFAEQDISFLNIISLEIKKIEALLAICGSLNGKSKRYEAENFDLSVEGGRLYMKKDHFAQRPLIELPVKMRLEGYEKISDFIQYLVSKQ